jgi:hypothetical protein
MEGRHAIHGGRLDWRSFLHDCLGRLDCRGEVYLAVHTKQAGIKRDGFKDNAFFHCLLDECNGQPMKDLPRS